AVEAAAQRRAAAAAARRTRTAAAASAPAPAPTGAALQWPANGPKTSGYGWRTHPIFGTSRFHAGIDIGAGYGAAIVAADSGVVVSADSRGGYGNTVVIDHGGGMATLYAHQSSMSVSAGQSVSRGQVIGAVGSTGYSTGPHLHFEVRVNGATRDPMNYF
ncbi:MAG: peptidoglycan DD-metalloendopeptidase family protein, partial [Nitriliruptorales bacterium]|nr:peptidoglycan DD-metalloendopeptidase family protein [Nitriliruptorales bacterium]